MAKDQQLEVVDDNDRVIGLESREKVYKEGLLHRGVRVWFITPSAEVIFQHRSKDVLILADLLAATAGGGVEPGTSYEQTAVEEAREETGIEASPSELHFLGKTKSRSVDHAAHKINHTFAAHYVYAYKGEISDLKVEAGKATGFEPWPIDRLLNLSDEEKERFTPDNLAPAVLDMIKEGVSFVTENT